MSYVFDRRDFLKATAAGVAALTVPAVLPAADAKDPYLGLKLGLQSYSLREFKKTEEALEHTKALGLKFWEAYPAHVPMTAVPKQIQDHKDLLAKYDMTLISYGVLGFDENENAAREKFEFAKAMGIKSLSADPKPDKATFDLLDKLCAEYDVAIAIHNHGPEDKVWPSPLDVWEAVQSLDKRIGLCIDVGHTARCGVNPVEATRLMATMMNKVRPSRSPAAASGRSRIQPASA